MQLRAMGRGSISSLLKFAVDAAWIIAFVALGLIWIVTALSIVSANGGRVPLGGVERIVAGNPAEIARWTLNGTILCLGIMLICTQLRAVFETLVTGDPFVPENARRLRTIAFTLAGIEVVRMLLSLTVGPILQTFQSASGQEQLGLDVALSINLSAWFAVLTLLVLSQVFSEGAALREDQKMTI